MKAVIKGDPLVLIPVLLFVGLSVVYFSGGFSNLTILPGSGTAGSIILVAAGIAAIIIALIFVYARVIGSTAPGGKMCPDCCNYIEKGARKCHHCREKQLARRRCEDKKRAEKRAHDRVYEKLEKTLGNYIGNPINKIIGNG